MIIAPMVCTGEMGGVLSNSDGGSDIEVQVGFVLIGCTGSSTDDLATECPISGAMEVSCLLNFVDHPSFTDTTGGVFDDTSEEGRGVVPPVINGTKPFFSYF